MSKEEDMSNEDRELPIIVKPTPPPEYTNELEEFLEKEDWVSAIRRIHQKKRVKPSIPLPLEVECVPGNLQLPLHRAIVLGAPFIVIKALVESYPDALKMGDGVAKMTPLHMACSPRDLNAEAEDMKSFSASAIDKSNEKIINFLIEQYPEAVVMNSEEGTPLHKILEHKPPRKLVEKMLAKFPEKQPQKMTDYEGSLPLHVACEYQADSRIITKLIELYPDGVKKKRTGDGRLPLHCAMFGSSEEVLRCLLSHYAQGVEIRDKDKDTPLHMALNEGRSMEDNGQYMNLKSTIKLLLKYYAHFQSQRHGKSAANLDVVHLLEKENLNGDSVVGLADKYSEEKENKIPESLLKYLQKLVKGKKVVKVSDDIVLYNEGSSAVSPRENSNGNNQRMIKMEPDINGNVSRSAEQSSITPRVKIERDENCSHVRAQGPEINANGGSSSAKQRTDTPRVKIGRDENGSNTRVKKKVRRYSVNEI